MTPSPLSKEEKDNLRIAGGFLVVFVCFDYESSYETMDVQPEIREYIQDSHICSHFVCLGIAFAYLLVLRRIFMDNLGLDGHEP